MDRRVAEKLKDLFAVPRGEAHAWIVVIVVILALAAWVTYEQVFAKPDPSAFAEERKVLEAWLAECARADTASSRAIELFEFDPNDLSVEDWMRLGLTERQALAINRYKERGGEFRSRTDLQRMRVVSPELFAQWKPFILLPDSLERGSRVAWRNDRPPFSRRDTTHASQDRPAARTAPGKLEVNSCDSAQLVALRGIGPSFARGIIKYRDQLGGYVSLDQLAEVFVLKDKPDAVARIKELLVVDTTLVHRIAINTCTVEELAAHPYLRWKLAKPLAAYRDQHGPFTSVAAIKGCAVITDEVYGKIAPYLTVD